MEGRVDPDWKQETLKSFRDFRLRLSEEQLGYDPCKRRYKGDENFRVNKKAGKKKKKTSSDASILSNTSSSTRTALNKVTIEDIEAAEGTTRTPGRLCMSGSDFHLHLAKTEMFKNRKKCEVCGKWTFWRCTICDAPIHVFAGTGHRKWDGAECAMKYHSPEFFGLARSDSAIRGKRMIEWTPPLKKHEKANKDHIERLLEQRKKRRSEATDKFFS